ncbi:MAG: CysB family HTH-type transcriptional regulator [Betaproteobacteria bacterium]|nr:CysB family HTH-type transcriptional regulator [Betaproteobacteria bacterium]MBK7744012.1 CysB family HTH-type transcriptional regulator [Betaproteobacteria bacterium]
MNLQQLRYVRETVRRNLNITEAANALFTSQPGVSKQIKELEDELGVEIFVRRGRRVVGLTEPGRAVVKVIDRLLVEAENLERVGREYADKDSGGLVIATTHTQARYALPRVVSEFRRRYPKVRLSILQGHPPAIAQLLARGEADIGIATESLAELPDLVALPAYEWSHAIIVPPDHPLADRKRVRLEDLARFPIVTYSSEFTGRSHIDRAFAEHGLPLDVVLTAIDSDVIKTYVELGLGVGIIAAMAFDPGRDRNLRRLEANHLFPRNTTRVAVRRGVLLRGYIYDFIELFAPELTREAIGQASSDR